MGGHSCYEGDIELMGVPPVPPLGKILGYVQKRLSSRLRTLRSSYKNTKTPHSGQGKLTDKVVNMFQNYFGMAIRQNQGKLYPMDAILVQYAYYARFSDVFCFS